MLRSTGDYYEARVEVVAATVAAVRHRFSGIGEGIADVIAAGQMGMAATAVDYVGSAMAEQELVVAAAAGRVPPSSVAGAYTVDGVAVGSLDAVVSATVEELLAQSEAEALAWLDRFTAEQLAAAASAAEAASTANVRVTWTRMVNPPCCQRCAVLAGRTYKVQGFQRHPHCDCVMVPTSEAKMGRSGAWVSPEDITDLTRAQRRAIEDGADMIRVINAHRVRVSGGVYTPTRSADGLTTTAFFGKPRLTPYGIYQLASDEDDAIRLLTVFGYIVP